jgi:hypothetical protein
MKLEQFTEKVQKDYPEIADFVTRKGHEYALQSAMRKVLMEVTDPGSVARETAERLSSQVHLTNYLNAVGQVGFAEGWMSLEDTSKRNEGMVKLAPADSSLGKMRFLDKDGKHIQVSNVWVDPEIRREMQDLTGWGAESGGRSKNMWRGALNVVYRLSGLAKYGLVVLNPPAHFRNFVSTTFIHALRGGAYDLRATYQAGYSASGQIREALTEGGAAKRAANVKQEIKWLEDQAYRHGMLYDGGRSGAVADIFQALHDTGQSPEEMIHAMGRTQSSMAAASSMLGRGKDRSLNIANELFRLEDEWVKLAAFATDTKLYLRLHSGSDEAFYKAQRGEELTAEEQDIMDAAMKSAAESTLNRYPTFSRAANWVKRISRVPVLGAFPTFSYEMIRTTVNNWHYLGKLLNGKTYDGKRIESAAGRTRARARALMLLGNEISLHTATSMIGANLAQAAIAQSLEWLDDGEEDRSLLEELQMTAIGRSTNEAVYGGLLPTYLDHTHSYVTKVDRNKHTATIVNYSYVNPYGAIQSALMEYGERLYEAAQSNDPFLYDSIFAGALDAFISVFGNEEVLAGGIYDRVTRRGDPVDYPDQPITRTWGNAIERAIDNGREDHSGFQIIGATAGVSWIRQTHYEKSSASERTY